MLKIGEFSRLSQVTVKTLHHYDEIGLLKPSHVDKFTEYRYYTLEQLPRIHSIMALKELGLSLEQIAELLNKDLSPEEIRGMYRLKLEEAETRVREEQARLAQIAFRLRQIEGDGMVQTVDIAIKRVDPFYALTVRGQNMTKQERDIRGYALIRAGERIKWTGAAPVLSYHEKEFRGDYSDEEVMIPVGPTHLPIVMVDNTWQLELRQIPAIEAAATYLHQGDYDTLDEKYLFLQRWAVENGYKLGESWRFVYHRGPMHNVAPSLYLTEL
jgi:DNA-binding transcriptional MerR regulator/effector-binding domain-containing protein